MSSYDFVIVGGGSAGAALAARLSEDPGVSVALIEAGDRPPPREAMPVACATLQLDPETDWMMSGDPGKGGRGFKNRRMPAPRGKMLGGSSGINYMVFVRGHPGDFDHWAELGAEGWSYEDVLPCFKRMEEVAPTNEASIDRSLRGYGGPVGVGIRSPVIPAARDFVRAAEAVGIPAGDYNGAGRFNPAGVASLTQTNTRRGKRSSTFHAYLEGTAEQRDNLTIITGAHVTRLILDGQGEALSATGVEYRDREGELGTIQARREVILSAGAVGSPHILMLSGVGPRRELEAAGIACRLDLPAVGKHLKDHVQAPMVFAAPGVGVSMAEIGVSAGPDALRAPAGPLPADPADDAGLAGDLALLKAEAERRLSEWVETGASLVSSSLYDGISFYSTGLGDGFTHDAQIGFIPCGYDAHVLGDCINLDLDQYLEDPATALASTAENVLFLASNCVPHSEGELVIVSADPATPPDIRFNYFSDSHDLKVMVAIMRRVLAIAENWPAPGRLGPWLVPPKLAALHGFRPGEPPSDALLENFALHFGMTVYHLSCTCRIGSVVDPRLRVIGVGNLRIADASVMPEIPSGNINAPSIMIGERAADLIAADHGIRPAAMSA
ncbi:MAG TPA: GMC family oxidoreductase N-terminal domain-containing protein [Caulobacteraceae bacterium]|jgi:choline dehydrogenase|nr:GMC family oxidoreductase N-terminal domain-containing protein [Caulobacteraceae bacterium]